MLAGFLGWTLDAFDFFLVNVSQVEIAREFHKSDKEIALAITVTLAARPIGALIFGLLCLSGETVGIFIFYAIYCYQPIA